MGYPRQQAAVALALCVCVQSGGGAFPSPPDAQPAPISQHERDIQEQKSRNASLMRERHLDELLRASEQRSLPGEQAHEREAPLHEKMETRSARADADKRLAQRSKQTNTHEETVLQEDQVSARKRHAAKKHQAGAEKDLAPEKLAVNSGSAHADERHAAAPPADQELPLLDAPRGPTRVAAVQPDGHLADVQSMVQLRPALVRGPEPTPGARPDAPQPTSGGVSRHEAEPERQGHPRVHTCRWSLVLGGSIYVGVAVVCLLLVRYIFPEYIDKTPRPVARPALRADSLAHL